MYRLGIDLGGTNIVAGVVDENHKIIAKSKTKTLTGRTAEEICNDMARISREAAAAAGLTLDDIDGFGIGTPGSVDRATGTVIVQANAFR